MIIENDDIAGYFLNNEVVCSDCATKEETDEATQDEIIILTKIKNDDSRFFCDRCKKQL